MLGILWHLLILIMLIVGIIMASVLLIWINLFCLHSILNLQIIIRLLQRFSIMPIDSLYILIICFYNIIKDIYARYNIKSKLIYNIKFSMNNYNSSTSEE
jgi:hypothetical protein